MHRGRVGVSWRGRYPVNAAASLADAALSRANVRTRRKETYEPLGGLRVLPSRPGEFHPEPLTDPDLILSHHPARATARRLPPSVENWSSSCYQLARSQRR